MLNNIIITNYRNLAKVTHSITSPFTIIIEKNGTGKTNLLESIYYSIFRHSFRPLESYKELIGPSESFTKVTTKWKDSDEIVLLLTSDPSFKKKITKNDKSVSTNTILKDFPVLLFAPHSVNIVSGEPAIRRADLDDFLSLYIPIYNSLLKTYKKTLNNRNAVIRAIRDNLASKDQLTFWTEKLAELSEEITKYRSDFFQSIHAIVNEMSIKMYHDITNISIKYLPNLKESDSEKSYLEKFNNNIDKEIMVGKTLYGAHKDDFYVEFRNNNQLLNLKFHGSRGQQRIGSFIYKMAQYILYKQKREVDVFLLLDDIMSELDPDHRNNIANFLISNNIKGILTGADIQEIPESIIKNAEVLRL